VNNGEQNVYVLDSHALIAYFDGEPGAQTLITLLADEQQIRYSFYLSVINLGELYYIFARERTVSTANDMLAVVEQLPIFIVDAHRPRVLAAAHIKAHYALTYADAFVVATAQEFSATVLTGDPEFKRVEHLVRVEWLPVEPR
jgi:ribonuclease VapC